MLIANLTQEPDYYHFHQQTNCYI